MNNKKQLRDYVVANWKQGVEESKMLNRCYPGINKDIQSLVDEGWIRVLMDNKSNSRNDSKTRVFFACDKSD